MSTPSRIKLANYEFIQSYLERESNKYREASFLKTPFNSHVWTLDFGLPNPLTVDFNFRMLDGKLITNDKHRDTLALFKMWICAADISCANKGRHATNRAKMGKVILTLNLIDYFLINSGHFRICENGLRLLNENDHKVLLSKLASSARVSTGIYCWPQKLSSFLLGLAKSIPLEILKKTIIEFPFLQENLDFSLDEDTTEVDDFFLATPGLTGDSVALIRAALWNRGLYKPCGMSDFRYVPHVRKLTQLINPNTLWGKTHNPTPRILSLRPIERRRIEMPRAPTRNNHSSMDCRRLSDFSAVLTSVNFLKSHSPVAPVTPLTQLDMKYILTNFAQGSSGRFVSAPTSYILQTLCSAVEFYLEFGNDIIDSYIAITKIATQSSDTMYRVLSGKSIACYLSDSLKGIGVSLWTTRTTEEKFSNDRRSRSEYFVEFRKTPGLWELLRILYGAIQFTLGVLQARRESELRNADAGSCLTEDFRNLVTANRKTGALGINQSITRPIPTIASDMVRSLQRLQQCLIDLNLLNGHKELFSHPSVYGSLVKASHTSYNANIDYFCDYVETPCDSQGRRYYFRQHQLRRFFAQVFFWSQSDDSLDVLRWVLGHTDSKMIYHYITESTPGKVLRQVKSEWGSNQIKSAAKEVSNLTSFLSEKYGALDFSIIPSDALDIYIDHCLMSGEISIEPDFIHGPSGLTYKIIVIINQNKTT